MKTLKISDDTHRKLTTTLGTLMARTGSARAPKRMLIGKAETKNNVTKTKPTIAPLFILIPPLSYTYRSTTELNVCINNHHKKFFTAI
jgi:hypothetical protein